jgi:hypothetical protein
MRATLLASLEYVDYVVIFDEDTVLPLARKITPDVIAKDRVRGRQMAGGAICGKLWGRGRRPAKAGGLFDVGYAALTERGVMKELIKREINARRSFCLFCLLAAYLHSR